MRVVGAMPKKVVVAVEGSRPSMEAAEYALGLAKIAESPEVRAVFVVLLPKYLDAHTVELLRKQLKEKGEETLDKLRKQAEERGVKFEGTVLETTASIANAICAFSEKQGADLIVLGTRTDSTPVTSLMIGSTAMSVTNNATCSVLIVR